MDINSIVSILAESVKDEAVRKEFYTKLLETCDEYDIEDAETGIDHAFDEVFEDFAPDEDEEEYEEDDDYDNDDDDGWGDDDSSDESED